jgi:NADH-quinone oxidoreductase subunit F
MPEMRVLLKWVGDPRQVELETYLEHGGYAALRKALAMQPDEIIELIKASDLRGRGGAGALCGMKWGFMPKNPTAERPNYLICNADESEPGSFSNRELLERDPHQVIEGLMIASYALRVRKAFIYCRGEFLHASEVLLRALADLRERGMLGENILESGFGLDIVLLRGAGAYICGEETALMESLEGRRGHPRSKPPFPANAGLYQMPTTINNVETLCNVVHIVNNGLDWYRGMGTPKNTGTKIISISGHVRKPGNYEVVMGTPLREVIYDIAGGIPDDRDLKAVIPGGSSMPMLPKEVALEAKLDFDSLQAIGSALGTAGVIVFDETTCIPRVCVWIADFYRVESCGKCVPCRIGTDWLHKLIARIENGCGRLEDIELLRSICVNLGGEKMMDSRSFCPLGDAAAWPILWGGLKYFQHEFEQHIRERRCPAAG